LISLSQKSQWTDEIVHEFLETALIPMRIAVVDEEFPFICSVWFHWNRQKEQLLCVSHQDSYLLSCLRKDAHCAFEIAPNTRPYQGVRGKGIAILEDGKGKETLELAIDRYLDGGSQKLASWLLRRADQETLITISPKWMTTWDYSKRMDPS